MFNKEIMLFILISLILIPVAIFADTLPPSVKPSQKLYSGETSKIFFEDDFDSVEIDSIKWNTSIDMNGKRWCNTSFLGCVCGPGEWIDVSLDDTCSGATQQPPYGTITLAESQVYFNSVLSRTFPYIWSGPPSKQSPFPSVGDFIMEVRMKYTGITGCGTGFFARFWENSDPIGNNPADQIGDNVLQIWADETTIGFKAFLLGNVANLYNPFEFHNYRVEYISGKYSLFVDEVLELGPIVSNLTPNTIWIGNPAFIFNGTCNWTSFSIDSIRVTVPDSIPTLITLSSFTATPSNHRVILDWTTSSEIDNAGFNLYRAESEDGEYVKINSSLILAKGSPTEGASYQFIDKNVQNRKMYLYKLEDIDLSGKSMFHDPVLAIPRGIYKSR